MNTKRTAFLTIAVVSLAYTGAYSQIYVHNNDAVAAELIRQRAEHERRYPSQARSMEILRDLYDTNKFFYKLPSVQEQLDYLLEMFPESIKSGERLVEMSKAPDYDQKRYSWGIFFTVIAALTVQQSISWIKRNGHKTLADNSMLSVLVPTILIGAPIITIMSLVSAYYQFKVSTHWCTRRLQKDREIYALLLKEAKKIES